MTRPQRPAAERKVRALSDILRPETLLAHCWEELIVTVSGNRALPQHSRDAPCIHTGTLGRSPSI